MGDPRVTERDNPLVRRLNAVAQMNAEAGAALGGGSRPPRPEFQGPVQGGSATVLPPPAVPLPMDEASPKEQAELEALWAQDPMNPANRQREAFAQGNVQMSQNEERKTYVPEMLQSTFKVPVDRANYATIIDALPLTEEQRHQVKVWTFEGAAKQVMTETADRLDALQIAFGLAPKKEEPKEVAGERGEQAEVAKGEPAKSKRVRRAKRTTLARSRKGLAAQGEPAA